jgi:hypothetical protein
MLKGHVLLTRLETMEVFRIHPEDAKAKARWVASHDVPDLGGWLVEFTAANDLRVPIRAEIELRENWVRSHNLDAARFRAWSKAQQICKKRQ